MSTLSGKHRQVLHKPKKTPLPPLPLPTPPTPHYTSISPFEPGCEPRLECVNIPPCPAIYPYPPSTSTKRTDLCDASVNTYRELDHFSFKNGMRHHPYGLDAPYMQAYDPLLLENDRYTDILLQKINKTGTPTFRVPSKPPSNALDLGCGAGHWVLRAAAAWKSAGTRVVGLDLVDVLSEEWKTEKASSSNVEFVRGNFLKYKLPFPRETFDLVRLANLALCIPYDKWEFVLGEVRRVLTPSGRLELIDDQIFYAYGKPPSSPSSPPPVPPKDRPFLPFTSDDDEESDEGIDMDFCTSYRKSFPDPSVEWEASETRSKNLETVFERMLEKKYRIHPRPSSMVCRVLKRVFGKDHVNKMESKHLLLAPSDSPSPDGDGDSDGASTRSTDSGFTSGSSISQGQGKKSWITIEWDRDKRAAKSSSPSAHPQDLSFPHVKAGLDRRSHRYQTPGLILWPSTFIPMAPSELEMHVCKHMHILLGCKLALGQYISEFKGEDGQLLVDDKGFQELLWDYECFRRQRFNWPSDTPEMRMQEHTLSRKMSFRNRVPNAGSLDLTIPFTSGRFKRGGGNADDPNYKYEDLTHVRSFRIFEAIKVGN